MPEHPNSENLGRGSDRDYCSAYPTDGHHMVSHSAGEKVRWVERCSLCGWIDAAALDGWVDHAIKEQMTKRAQRIALAAESEPFSFHQSSTEELTLEEVLFQALGAASMCWVGGTGSLEFDSVRASQVGHALLAEVQRFIRIGDPAVKAWSDLAYELYALACNSSPNVGYPADKQAEWQKAFERLRDRFHELLPAVNDRLKEEASGDGDRATGPAGIHRTD
jgi:hypothetical protein